MQARQQRRPAARQGASTRRARWLLASVVLAAGGCTAWDDVTSKDFHFKDAFRHPDPPLVIVQKDPDGDHRAKALRTLQEPLTHGGTAEEQEAVVRTLVTCATTDQQALCRLAAISTLGCFQDPRAVEALKDAYYRAGSFNPETAAILKCQALTALGKTGQPAGAELLVKVLREPPVEGSEAEKQQKTDERIVAARALSRFPNDYHVTQALVDVLRNDQDVGLRNRSRESLVQITGKDLPPEAKAWDDFFHNQGQAVAETPGPFDQIIRRVTGRE